jgi:hypothetical protein
MKKDIIFYSNYCTYSKEIINQLSKTTINDNIIYVCVDDENIQLPPFIKAVPTIYLVNDKKIVVDEAITSWIKEKVSVPDKVGELQAYYGGCGNSYGSGFENIDNSESKPFISSFTFIGEEQEIKTPEGQSVGGGNNGNNGNNSLDNSKYDQMVQGRNNDFKLPQRR